MKQALSYVINDKTSIKNQLFSSYTIMSLISVGITLAICVGLMKSLGDSAYTIASTRVSVETVESVVAVSVEISSQIGQQLRIVSDTIAMAQVLYSSILIGYSNISSVQGTLLRPQTSFHDFNFVSGCQYPKCPADYGYMLRSRLPPQMSNGSMQHTSVYLYSDFYQEAVRNDSMWNQIVEESPEVTNIVNALPYQDLDLMTLYTRGVNMSSMYYQTSRVENFDTGKTNVIHRTFPGVALDDEKYGDPSQNDWFQKAPINAAYLQGPLKEPFTGQLSIILSSRKSVTSHLQGQEQSIVFVSAAVVLLDRLAMLLNNVQYNDGGYGSIFRLDNFDVLCWKNAITPVYNETSGQFFKVSHFRPVLGAMLAKFTDEEKLQRHNIKYIDASGVEWVVSYVPFYATKELHSNVTYNSLVMLVFSRTSLAYQPLFHLKSEIRYSTSLIVLLIVIVLVVTMGVVIVLVCFAIQYITSPLPKMMGIAEEIIQISTADDAHKDYSVITNNPLFKLNRRDEIGLLISDYYQLLTVLQVRTMFNRNNSQYPQNPFHIIDDDFSNGSKETQPEYTWRWFVDKILLKLSDDQRAAMMDATKPKTSKRIVAPKVSSAAQSVASNAPIGEEAAETSIKRHKKKEDNNSYRRGGNRKVGIEAFSAIPEEEIASERDLPESGAQSGVASQEVSARMSVSDEVIQMKKDAAAVESAGHAVVAGQKYVPNKSLPSSKGEANRKVTNQSSLKTLMSALFAVLLTGMVITMIVVVTRIQIQGVMWTSHMRDDLRVKVTNNLQSIVQAKAKYVESSFNQISLGLITSSRFMGEVLRGNFTRDNWYNDTSGELYLRSPSVDPHNPSFPGTQAVGTHNFSGCFIASSARCEQTGTCDLYQDSFNTKVTSLFSLKLKSLLRTGTSLTFMQTGLESDGTMRYLPYNLIRNVSYPSTCYVQDLTAPFCAQNYYNSSCNKAWVNPAGKGKKKFPVYDSRCRGWYQTAAAHSAADMVFFRLPTVADNGAYTQPATIAVRQSADPSSPLLAVLTANYLITSLSKSIQTIDYLSEGYVYVVQAANTSILIVHPNANTKCKYVHCAEGFTPTEYDTFVAEVLNPLQNYEQPQQGNVTIVYTKAGRKWQMVYTRAHGTSINFVLVATMPVDVIQETATTIKKSIDNTVVGMIIAFILAIVFLIVFSGFYAFELVSSVVDPINELRKVFELVRMNEDLSGQVPEVASSSDMRIMLDAFSKLMVSMRFGSESYAQGNQKRAREVYTDALSLYTGNNDKRGIGISLCNLAESEVARKRFDAAETLYKKSIDNALDILQDRMESRDEVLKMDRMLSDRRGALASLYLDEMRYDEAMAILTPALERDVKKCYIIGYALKQASIANYYMDQGDLSSAETVLKEMQRFLRQFSSDHKMLPSASGKVMREEVESAQQITLCRLAKLVSIQQASEKNRAVESAYITCLLRHSIMHTATAVKALIALKSMFAAKHRNKDILELDFLAQEFNLNISRDTTRGAFSRVVINPDQPPRRVMFTLDYSAGMAGVKQQAVMDNVNTVFEMHLSHKDSMSIIYFNHKVRFAQPMTPKKANELLILDNMEKLTNPKGGCAMFDALGMSMYALALEPTDQDWLVLVTNSDDSNSRLPLQIVLDKVMFAKVGLIIISIGEDVRPAALELMASSTKRGVYFHSQADKKSINEAFEHAMHIINTAHVKGRD